MQNTHKRLDQLTNDEKRHFKMYKMGKVWVTAGISLIFSGAMVMQAPQLVGAETQAPVAAATSAAASSATSGIDAATSSETDSAVAGTDSDDSKGVVEATTSTSTTDSADAGTEATAETGTSAVTPGTTETFTDNVTASADTSADTATLASVASRNAAAQGQSQLKTQVAAVAAAQTATGTVSLDRDTIGNDGYNGNVTLTFAMFAPAGTSATFTLNLPAGDTYSYDSEIEKMPAADGTTTTKKNADGSITVTNVLSHGGNFSQEIVLHEYTNGFDRSAGLTEVGTTVKSFTYTIDGVEQTPVTLTQYFTPGLDLDTPTLKYPSKNTDALLPDTTYVFSIGANEWNGVQDQGGSHSRVNSAVNFGGTTITIPVPAGFTLDSDLTNKLNVFTDGTTITQDVPGGDVLITVPAKKGGQTDSKPYLLAGAFEVAQTSEEQTLTAAGNATFKQITNAAGDVLTDEADNPWQVVIAAADSEILLGKASVTAKGNSNNDHSKILLDTDDTNDAGYLEGYTFSTSSIAELTDAKLTITIPNGFAATSVVLPMTNAGKAGADYLLSIQNYQYVLTLADGTQMSGVAAPGETLTTTGSAIRTIELSPDLLVPGTVSGAANSMKGDIGGIYVTGKLATTYDDGTPVNRGDQLKTTITLTSAGLQTATVTQTQTVITAEDTIAQVSIYVNQSTNEPGAIKAGLISLSTTGDAGQTAFSVFEPIYYYVLPAATTFNGVSGVDPAATVTEYTTEDGRRGIKIDYTGTGLWVTTQETGKVQVNLSNSADALPGDYPYEAYVTSPLVKLTNSKKPSDLSLTDGDENAVMFSDHKVAGPGTWGIASVATSKIVPLAQGNVDGDAVLTGAQDVLLSTGDVANFLTMMNTSDKGVSHATALINLPQVGDSNGSTVDGHLTGPVKVPTTYADGTEIPAGTVTVLYSTTAQTPVTGGEGTQPSTAGYVTADQITDWSTVKSVILQYTQIPKNNSTDRIELDWNVDDQFDEIGGVGYLQTAYYADSYQPDLSVASTSASVAFTANAEVTARLHYVDDNGTDQYVDLPDLAKTYQAATDTMAETDFPQTLNDTDTALIPAGYELVENSRSVINSDDDYGTHENLTATIGGLAQYYFNNDIVQYELVAEQAAQISFIDDALETTLETKTVHGGSNETSTYSAADAIAAYEAQGYALVSSDVPATLVFDDDANALQSFTVHLTHQITTGTAQTSRTIHYQILNADGTVADDQTQAPAEKTQTIDWHTVTDKVTGESYATAQDYYDAVSTPGVTGYDASEAEVAEARLGNVALSEAVDSDVTVTYTPAAKDLTIEFVDDDADGQVVGDTQTIPGATNTPYDWTAGTLPTGYKLADGQVTSGTYPFTVDGTGLIQIHLKHIITYSFKTTTDLIQYQINDPDGNAAADQSLAPDEVARKTLWTVVTDEATGKSIATAHPSYKPFVSPEIEGYHPSLESIAISSQTSTPLANVTDGPTTIVYYSPMPRQLTLTYVDDDAAGKMVGSSQPIDGVTTETVDWNTNDKPAGYALAGGQDAAGSYTLTGAADQTITVHLTHIITNSTKTTTRTIHYQINDADGNASTDQTLAPVDAVQEITWKIVTDEATGESVATAQSAYAPVTSPTVAGYTADSAEVETLPQGSLPTAEVTNAADVTVAYTPDSKALTIKYVDDDLDGKVVATSDPIDAVTNENVDWNTDDKPAGYTLAAGQDAAGSYTLTDAADQTVTVHVTHIITNSTLTTTRTIHYQSIKADGTPAADQSGAPTDVTQDITWKIVTDKATGASFATAQSAYASVISPTVAGYTADTQTVGVLPQGALPLDEVANAEDVLVGYVPDSQTLTLTYVDDDLGGQTVLSSDPIDGATNETVSWNTEDKPAGYALIDGQDASGSYTYTAFNNQTVIIHLKHLITNGTKTTTRTIHYQINNADGTLAADQSKAPADSLQTIEWHVVTDQATGTSYATAQDFYAAVASPLIAGYEAESPEVAALHQGNVPVEEAKDVAVTVAYTPTGQTLTIEYVDDDEGGQIVGAPKAVAGVTDQVINWNTDDLPDGYALAADQDRSGAYTVTADSDQTVKIHLKHIISTGTITTNRTIDYRLNDATGAPAADQSKVPMDVIQRINWHVVTDEATGESIATALDAYDAVVSPNVEGYTPSTAAVAYFKPGTLPADEVKNAPTLAVVYTPITQQLTLIYVDDDAAGQKVGESTPYAGATDTTVLWQTDDKPAGYVLADGQAATGTYEFSAAADQTLTIHVKHLLTNSTATTTRTIHAVAGVGVDAATLPADIVQTIDWQIVTDHALGTSVATPQAIYAVQTLRSISLGNGETLIPDQAQIAQAVPGATTDLSTLTDATVDVTYSLLKTPTTDPQVWIKEENDEPAVSAGHYTINFVTYDGTIVGTETFDGNAGDLHQVVAPSGWSFAPGVDDNVELTDTPETPITKLVAEPAGQVPNDGTQAWLNDVNEDAPSAEEYTVNFVTYDGTIVGTMTLDGNVGNLYTVDAPDGWIFAPGVDGDVELTDTPETPITKLVAEPKGVETTDDPQVWTKEENGEPTSAETYTVNFVTYDGTVVGTETFDGNAGDLHQVVAPSGWSFAPGVDGNVELTDTPETPITKLVAEPKGVDTTDDPQVWTKEENGEPTSAETYTVNFITYDGTVVGTTTLTGNDGNHFTVDAPNGWSFAPGVDGDVELTDTPETPITKLVAEPKGVETTDDPQVWTKEENGEATSAETYTVNFVTYDGTIVGTTTLDGNEGNHFTVDAPDGWSFAPGVDGNGELTDTPETAITKLVAEPKGVETTDDPQVWTKEENGEPTSAEAYTVNFITYDGTIVGTTTLTGNDGNHFTVDAPDGWSFAPGVDGDVVLTDTPETAITKLVAEPKGIETTDDPQVWTKEENGEPTSAETYTVHFVTYDGTIVGTMTLTGNAGNHFTVTAPNGWTFAPGLDGDVELTDTPATAITKLVAEPAGQETTTNPQVETQVPMTDVPTVNRYTIIFVDENGDVVDSLTMDGKAGTTRTVTAPAGWHFAPGTDGDVTFTDTPEEVIALDVVADSTGDQPLADDAAVENGPSLPLTGGAGTGDAAGKAADQPSTQPTALTSGQTAGASAGQSSQNVANNKTLPQTGDSHNNVLAVLGVTLLSLLALAGWRRKRED
ncbi:mucin-binding protein [Lacticaseibacillus mingshuiensis]|uniref:mucin-binding protein n=1 Tax=Lacticaseibacillus mingshuiensis TaxID=2799574 RepID=UPI0019409E07|nr:LPXTG cell wall anchor domain-containing protein [Lacticaseibacillus mingshuiensis]